MPVQHGEQHRQPVLFQPHAQPPRIGRVRLIHQRLDLHQQRPRAFLRHHHAGTRHLLSMVRKEQRGRIAYLTQTFFGHGEHAQFVHRAKAVLEGANQAETGVGVAFEIQHRIDHVLQHARPGQRILPW